MPPLTRHGAVGRRPPLERAAFGARAIAPVRFAATAALLVIGSATPITVTRAGAEMRALPVYIHSGEGEVGGSWPAACSDGRRIAFQRLADIHLLDIQDTSRTAVKITDWPKWDGKPSWSPDCSRIAFMSDRSGDEDIWVYSLETGAYQQMTFSYEGPGLRAQEWGPAWSPDGSRIAFSSDRSDDDDLWWVPATGGELHRITKRTLARGRDQDRYPSWSPDGKRIAYASQATKNWDIWIVTVDDTSAAPVQVTTDSTDEWCPAWSPNGRWISFMSNRTGNIDIFAMPAVGGDAVRITENPGSDQYPCWSADGKRLFYSGVRGEEFGIWVVEGLEEVLGADFAARR